MPRPRNHVPTYRLHKQSGQAIVTISTNGTRRDVLLGKYGTPESKEEYRRLLAELQTSGPTSVAARAGGSDRTVAEVMLAFLQWATAYYKTPDGTQTSELSSIKRALKPLKELYAGTLAAEFGPQALAVVRDQMVKAGLCRSLVNKRIDRVKRMFEWATAEELVPVAVYQSLRTLVGLRRGRTEAHESEPIKPVDPAHVAATLPHLNRHVRTVVELHMLTGMRRPLRVRPRLVGAVAPIPSGDHRTRPASPAGGIWSDPRSACRAHRPPAHHPAEPGDAADAARETAAGQAPQERAAQLIAGSFGDRRIVA